MNRQSHFFRLTVTVEAERLDHQNQHVGDGRTTKQMLLTLPYLKNSSKYQIPPQALAQLVSDTVDDHITPCSGNAVIVRMKKGRCR